MSGEFWVPQEGMTAAELALHITGALNGALKDYAHPGLDWDVAPVEEGGLMVTGETHRREVTFIIPDDGRQVYVVLDEVQTGDRPLIGALMGERGIPSVARWLVEMGSDLAGIEHTPVTREVAKDLVQS